MNRKALWTLLLVCILMSIVLIINAITSKLTIMIVCAALSLIATIIFAIVLCLSSKKEK